MSRPSPSASTAVEVDTRYGRVRGERQGGGCVFRGVPYGADTSGARRFQAPAPPQPWTGVRDATRAGPRCPQVVVPRGPLFQGLGAASPMSEDCLVLNVFTPDADDARRPVMVWLHGGAFSMGSADAPWYQGGPLAEQGDVVVVGVNHRLNVLGYMPPLGDGPEWADAGNAGMLDLVAALQWVRDHIAAFGGDPDCVTVFGQSGGGAKVVILGAMPAARGLYHRAIVQSPSSGFRVQAPEDARRQGLALLQRLGLERPDRAALQALQALPESRLRAAMAEVVAAEGGDDHFRPVIDGRHLVAHPVDDPHWPPAVPTLIGCTATEATFFLAADPDAPTLDEARVVARLARFMKLDADTVRATMADYASRRPGASPADLLVAIASDHLYRLNTVEGAEAMARRAGAPVYLYRFDWASPAMNGWLRTPHTADIPFIFGHAALATALTGGRMDALTMQHTLQQAWLRFARHGDPNGGMLPPWPALTPGRRETLLFDLGHCRMAEGPDDADLHTMAGLRRFVPGNAMSFRAD